MRRIQKEIQEGMMNRAKNLNNHPPSDGKAGSWSYFQISVAGLLAVSLLGLFTWWAVSAGQSQPTAKVQVLPEIGKPAPDFALTSLTGERIQLSDYKGQVVVVNLWATWCPPCRAEMPMIHAYYLAHSEAGLTVLAVNDAENVAAVKQFISAHGYQFPVVLDTQSDVSALYQVRGLPTTLVIDREGRLQYVQTGEISAKQLDAAVKPLL